MRFEKRRRGGKFSYKREGERRPERERERDWEVERKRKGYNYGMTWHGMD